MPSAGKGQLAAAFNSEPELTTNPILSSLALACTPTLPLAFTITLILTLTLPLTLSSHYPLITFTIPFPCLSPSPS